MPPFSSVSPSSPLRLSLVTTAEPDVLLELRSTVDPGITRSQKSAYNIGLYGGLFTSTDSTNLR